jgi:hypothetical protein
MQGKERKNELYLLVGYIIREETDDVSFDISRFVNPNVYSHILDDVISNNIVVGRSDGV